MRKPTIIRAWEIRAASPVSIFDNERRLGKDAPDISNGTQDGAMGKVRDPSERRRSPSDSGGRLLELCDGVPWRSGRSHRMAATRPDPLCLYNRQTERLVPCIPTVVACATHIAGEDVRARLKFKLRAVAGLVPHTP